MTTPRIYVACLAAYNNGRLHGRWIDADQSVDEIWSEVQAMLAASPEPGAEEWAIHDYEGFGALRLSEWESFERVSAIAAGIEQHGPAFTRVALVRRLAGPGRYRTRSRTRTAASGIRFTTTPSSTRTTRVCTTQPRSAARRTSTVDIDALERDLDIEMYTVESDHHTVYVFDPTAS